MPTDGERLWERVGEDEVVHDGWLNRTIASPYHGRMTGSEQAYLALDHAGLLRRLTGAAPP